MQVTLDRGSLVSSGRRAPFADLELRMIEGDVGNLYTLALQFAERVSTDTDAQSGRPERGGVCFLTPYPHPHAPTISRVRRDDAANRISPPQ
ncbi:MAG: hypothetical protein IPJ25_04095 [Rhodocyclaceae bacterium]|nr:hypothetical protein [Rhodocyclaceae bacterium]